METAHIKGSVGQRQIRVSPLVSYNDRGSTAKAGGRQRVSASFLSISKLSVAMGAAAARARLLTKNTAALLRSQTTTSEDSFLGRGRRLYMFS